MVLRKIALYVRWAERKGYSQKQIIKLLREQGYHQRDIMRALYYVHPEWIPKKMKVVPPKKPPLRKIIQKPTNASIAKKVLQAREKIKKTHSIMVLSILGFVLLFSIIFGVYWMLTFTACESDVMCSDNNPATVDQCIDPGARYARCVYGELTEVQDFGKNIIVNLGESIALTSNGRDYILSVKETSEDLVTIKLPADQREITLSVGEVREIDLTNDGVGDVRVELLSLFKEVPVFKLTNLERAARLNLAIQANSFFEVGQPVSGEYRITYSGQPFDGFVLVKAAREGFYNITLAFEQASFGSSPVTLPFKALKQDGRSPAEDAAHFFDEGSYTFELSAYSCEGLESATGKLCENMGAIDTPYGGALQRASKIITVSGGEISSETLPE